MLSKRLSYFLCSFLILLLSSCNTLPVEKEQSINYEYKVKPIHFDLKTDSIFCFRYIYAPINTDIKFGETSLTKAIGILDIQHETSILEINIQDECSIPFSYSSLNIKIQNGNFFCMAKHSSDISKITYYPIYQELILNTIPQRYEEEIIGKIQFKGISNTRLDTVTISGKFKFLIQKKEQYEGFQEALRSKEKVKNLLLKCEEEDFNQLSLFRDITTLSIYGSCDSFNIPKEISDLKLLETLHIIYPDLEKIPIWLSNLDSLKSLTFRGNNIKEIPKALEGNKNLTTIHLMNNKNGTFNNLQYLKELKDIDLSGCNLFKLPKGMENLKKLEILDLSHNSIIDMSDALKRLKKLPNLKKLYIDGFDIPQMLKDLSHFKHLEFLDISGYLTDEEMDGLQKLLRNTEIHI